MKTNDPERESGPVGLGRKLPGTLEPAPRPRRRRRKILGILAIVFVALIGLLVGAVFYATSEHCLRHFIVPRVSKAMGRDITFARARISLFRGVDVTQLLIGPAAGEEKPLLKADNLTVAWNFGALLHRRIELPLVSADALQLSLVEKPKRAPREPKPASEKKKSPGGGGELQASIDNLRLSNASIEYLRLAPESGKVATRYAVRELDVKGTDLGLGRPASLDLSARLEADDSAQGVNLTDGQVACKIRSEVRGGGDAFNLDGTWSVSRLKGEFHGVSAADLRATGSLQIAQSDPRRMTIQQADASISYRGREGAFIGAKGELDPQTADGKFEVNVRRVNRAFLNLLSTPEQPLDFGNTVVNARVAIETSQKATRTSVDGQLDLSNFSVIASKIAPTATPLTQLTLRCKALHDGAQNRLQLDGLEVKAEQEGRPVVTAGLSRSLSFSLAGAGGLSSQEPTELVVKIDRLALPQFNPFLRRNQVQIESGQLTVEATLAVAAGGQPISARGKLALAELRGQVAESKVGRTELTSTYDVSSNKGAISIQALACDVRQEGRPAGHLEGKGQVSPDAQKGELVLTGDRLDLSALQVLLAEVPNVKLRRGLVNFSQKIVFTGEKTPVQLEGRFDANELAFELPLSGRENARFSGWTVQGNNSVEYDRIKKIASIGTFGLSLEEKGAGRLHAVAGGNLDLTQGSGALNLEVAELGVRFLASVAGRLGTGVDNSALPSEGTLSCKANVKLDKQFDDLSIQGGLQTRGMKWAGGAGRAGAKGPSGAADLDSTYDVSLFKSNKRNELWVRDVTLKVAGAGAQPGSLGVKGQLDLAKNSGSLDVLFQRFDSAPVLSLVGPLAGPWRPAAGVLNGRETLKFGAGGELTAVGLVRAEGVLVYPPHATQPLAPPALEVEGNVALLGGGKTIRAERFSLRTFRDNARAGSLDVIGQVDLAKRAGELSLNVSNFETEPIWPLLAAMNVDVPITAGRLNAKQSVKFAAETSSVEAKGTLNADGIRIRPMPGKTPLEPLRLDLVNDLALTADRTDVRSLRLSTWSGGKPLDEITVTAKGGGLQSKEVMNVTLSAPTLHVDPYLAMVSGGGGETPKAAAPKAAPKPAPAAKAPGQAGTVTIPGPPIQAKLDIKRFYFDRYYAEEIAGQVAVAPDGVNVKPLTLRLADGAASATGWLRTDVPGMTYSANVGGQGLDVARLLAMVSPGSEKSLTGRGTTSLVVSGRGFDEASIRRDLRGQGWFRITDGEIKDVPILNALASVTNVGQLADIRFFSFEGQWQLQQAVIQILDASMVGSLQKLRAKGPIGFDQKIDLTFDLWLGGELANRLTNKNVLKYLKQESDRFLRLPVPIGVGGTLSKPRPTLNLPVESILDIGVEQGLKALQNRTPRLDKRRK